MNSSKILFQRLITLRGPNMWTYRPVIEAWVDLGPESRQNAGEAKASYDRLCQWLPLLLKPVQPDPGASDCLNKFKKGVLTAELLEQVTMTLQQMAGMPGGFSDTHRTSMPRVAKVIVRAWHEKVTLFALHAARDLILAAIENIDYPIEKQVDTLHKMMQEYCLGPSTACIVDAADDRDIPAIRLSAGNLLQLGYGVNQRRIWTAETDNTSAIAETISRDKDLTKSLLEACGVPVPQGRHVEQMEEAWQAAQDIGLPVVVKPSDGNHQRGVFINLSTQHEVEAAYRVAVLEGSSVLVEQYIQGVEHRLLIVGGKMVAAAKGQNAQVIGDGVRNIAELIETQINADPLRGHEDDLPLNFVRMSEAVRLEIARQGLTEQSIPESGRAVVVQRIGNVAIDCTDEVHPEVAAVAQTAAKIVGLDIAGIDLVAHDISRPLNRQGGAIVEVNAGPGLLMHLKPVSGKVRHVGRDIVDYTFAAGDMARVPVVGITGARGKTMTARILFRLLSLHGLRTGIACSDGLFVDRRQLQAGDCASFDHGRNVLLNREVQAAIIENGCQQILTEGLAYERCEVGIITNINWDEDLAHHDVLDDEERIKVYRTQMDVVLPQGMAVLNADDARVIDLARFCDGRITLFGMQASLATISKHIAQGGRAVLVDHGQLVMTEGGTRFNLCPIKAIPVTEQGKNAAQIHNALAAAAAAWALGLSPDLIEAGLISFDPEQSISSHFITHHAVIS